MKTIEAVVEEIKNRQTVLNNTKNKALFNSDDIVYDDQLIVNMDGDVNNNNIVRSKFTETRDQYTQTDLSPDINKVIETVVKQKMEKWITETDNSLKSTQNQTNELHEDAALLRARLNSMKAKSKTRGVVKKVIRNSEYARRDFPIKEGSVRHGKRTDLIKPKPASLLETKVPHNKNSFFLTNILANSMKLNRQEYNCPPHLNPLSDNINYAFDSYVHHNLPLVNHFSPIPVQYSSQPDALKKMRIVNFSYPQNLSPRHKLTNKENVHLRNIPYNPTQIFRLPIIEVVTFYFNKPLLRWDHKEIQQQGTANIAASYHLFSCQLQHNGEEPPIDMGRWRRICIINAAPLPMECTVNEFQFGKPYCFKILPLDRFGIPGYFSNTCVLLSF